MWISLKKYDFFVLTNMYQVYIICGGGGSNYERSFPPFEVNGFPL